MGADGAAMWGTQRRFVGPAATGAAVILCFFLADRPLALWADARCSGTTAFAISALILRSLDGVALAGAVLLVVAVVWLGVAFIRKKRRENIDALAADLDWVGGVVFVRVEQINVVGGGEVLNWKSPSGEQLKKVPEAPGVLARGF